MFALGGLISERTKKWRRGGLYVRPRADLKVGP